MGRRFDGLVCIDRAKRNFGFIVFRTEPGFPLVMECSRWCYPATDEGRAAASRDMRRYVERRELEVAVPSACALQAV